MDFLLRTVLLFILVNVFVQAKDFSERDKATKESFSKTLNETKERKGKCKSFKH